MAHAEVVPMYGRGARGLDLGQVARSQCAAARTARDMTHAQFAELLTAMVGWPVSGGTVEAWETSATPPGDILVACELIVRQSPPELGSQSSFDAAAQVLGDRFADLEAVYPSRSEFQAKFPTADLLEDAREIRVCGLSLNMLCQTYSDVRLRALLERGASLRALFLRPYGRFIEEREAEEGYPKNRLSDLTAMNVTILKDHVLKRLSPEAQGRLEIGTYDEPVRFNVLLIDSQLCVAQPYLPHSRGVDSPTFVVRKRRPQEGLYPVFEQTFTGLWENREAV